MGALSQTYQSSVVSGVALLPEPPFSHSENRESKRQCSARPKRDGGTEALTAGVLGKHQPAHASRGSTTKHSIAI